jgi:ribonuclease J
MSVNIKELKNQLLFIPLGGTNEIGINVNLYHYLGKWIMVDCGAGFADDSMPGVDIVVADISFIKKYQKDLLGIVLTHAHEDHLGAIPYLWEDLKCPIYATNFTANFLKSKLAEYHISELVEINSLNPGSQLDLGPFSIKMVPLAHSAPEMQALVIKTDKGTIFHTGDWKFDHDPLIGKDSDEKQLREIGDEGVLALVCDSTNVFNPDNSGSEGDLKKSLYEIIKTCPSLVIVTTFASNLARLDSLIRIGQSLNKKIVLSGRSIHRIINAAQDSGYMKDLGGFIDERDISRYKRNEILIIATGCQGEPLAAINKIANNTHKSIRLSEGDSVIFSSKIIPGNEKKIFALFNRLVKHNVDVKTERDHFVHVSGHPGVADVKRIFEYLRPKFCVPVHGEPVHIREHAKLAKNSNINAFELENGTILQLDEHSSKILGKVHTGYFGVDGDYLIPKESPVFTLRRKMNYSGVIIASIVLDKKYSLVCDPVVNIPGLVDEVEDIEFIKLIKDKIIQLIFDINLSKKSSITEESIQQPLKSLIKKLIKQEFGKEPIIITNISFVK